MTDLVAALRSFLDGAAVRVAQGFCVAYSGGVDSTALLHAMVSLRATQPRVRLRAIHVNHGLSPAADDWEALCADVCRMQQVELRRLRVRIASGSGPEGAARAARYAALAAELRPAEVLLTAHHRSDQLETLLLHLARGSGVDGLAGIPPLAALGAGWLARPLLDVPRERLVAYVSEHGLPWVEDPMNRDTSLDRGYLRARVLPALTGRWPGFAAGVARSARLCGEARELLQELGAADAQRIAAGGSIELEALSRLGDARRRNLLRHLVRERGWPMPPERRLRSGLAQLLSAGPDRQPRLAWPGGEIRRYRKRLYLLDAGTLPRAPTVARSLLLAPGQAVELGGGRGRLRLEPASGVGLDAALLDEPLEVRFRVGGERIALHAGAGRRSVKQLFQEHGVLPWIRDHVPLLCRADALLAVGDLWVSAAHAAPRDAPSFRVVWEHPAFAVVALPG